VSKARAAAVAARSLTPEKRKELEREAKAVRAAEDAAQAELDADPYGGLRPLVIERGEAVTFGVEHGGVPPKTPKAPPLMALFDWR